MDELAIYYFHQGTNSFSYRLLGAHKEKDGYVFRVYALHAKFVSVVGDFNGWNIYENPMLKITNEGLFEAKVKNAKEFDKYQYAITTKDDILIFKTDPYGFHQDLRPNVASKIYNLEGYEFHDAAYLEKRRVESKLAKPLNIYEVHLGSWRRYQDGNFFDYVKAAYELRDYVLEMGYTHIELLPLSEYPYDASWGYQTVGYFAVTSRYGTPKDFMKFIDIMHEAGIGVIMDFVPGHFATDAHGLACFDGDFLYEPANPKKRLIPEWGTYQFDYGRCEVQSFLISAAMFWCDVFHIDGLRVDAVSSMLYLDYGRKADEWELNNLGNNLNLEGIAFLKKMTYTLHAYDPSLMLIAEESTAFPAITKGDNALGFDFKWNMGWMNDTLKYMKTDPYFKGDHKDLISFQLTYIFSENYILALSHDEVVHLKASLLNKMPGDYDLKFANIRAYMTYMYTHPGKKLLFMGADIGEFDEWSEERELKWELLKYPRHQELKRFYQALFKIYKEEAALYHDDTYWDGFNWLVVDDREHSVFAYRRSCGSQVIVVVINLSFNNHYGYYLGVDDGEYEVILNSDEYCYGGKSFNNQKHFSAQGGLKIDLPMASGIILKKKEN